MADASVMTSLLANVNKVLTTLPGGMPSIPPVHIHQLTPAVAQHVGWAPHSIEVHHLSYPMKHVKGTLHRYAASANIYLGNDLNACWTRYVACKELSHLIIDAPADFTPNIGALLNGLITRSVVHRAVSSEFLANIAAIELLIPRSMYGEFRAQKAANASDYGLAVHFRVPAHLIEVVQSKEYQDISREMGATDIL